jgi:hypothetical protein
MARQNTIRAIRTTRASLNSQAAANGLTEGEFYFVTDEKVLAIGTAVNAYFDVIGPSTGTKTATLGVGETTDIPVGMRVLATGHATSRRATLGFGDYSLGQDYNANGTKDMYIYNGSAKLLGFDTAGCMDLPSGQITFPATQNPSTGANVLDDYEEGTTSPTPASSGGTLTSVSSALRYCKIGRLVTLHGRITVTTVGSGTGVITCALPFTAASTTAGGGGRENGVTGKGLAISIAANGTTLVMNLADGATPCVAGYLLDFSISYSAAS